MIEASETKTTFSGAPMFKRGDIVSFRTPGRKWWQFWKPKVQYFEVQYFECTSGRLDETE